MGRVLVLAGVLITAILLLDRREPPSQSGPRDFASEYGGNPAVYAEIERTFDCERLQEMFDIAAANNDRAKPGTPAHKWTLGYMSAADARMRAVGCYR